MRELSLKIFLVVISLFIWCLIGALPFQALAEGPKDVKDILKDRVGTSSPLYRIALCESGLKQYTEKGTVLRGIVNPLDIGIFQINLRYHGDASDRLGYDIFTLAGNIDYAKWLFEQEGTRPWNASRKCWNVS